MADRDKIAAEAKMLARLLQLRDALTHISEQEFRSALLGIGSAAQGSLDPRRQQIIDESEKLLDKLEKLYADWS